MWIAVMRRKVRRGFLRIDSTYISTYNAWLYYTKLVSFPFHSLLMLSHSNLLHPSHALTF